MRLDSFHNLLNLEKMAIGIAEGLAVVQLGFFEELVRLEDEGARG